jgi:hypothetical protein
MSVMVVVHFEILAERPEYPMLTTDRSRCIRGQVLTIRRGRPGPGILWDMTQCSLVDSAKVSERKKHENGSNTFVRNLSSCSKYDDTRQEMVAAFRLDEGSQFGTLGASNELKFCSDMPYRLWEVLNRMLLIWISDVAR